jgi:hypothetical protein
VFRWLWEVVVGSWLVMDVTFRGIFPEGKESGAGFGLAHLGLPIEGPVTRSVLAMS